ncbi:MAG: MarR family transcriptional regulator [candidate division WOR-3 bacterium]|nr:MAG: MarR family transcriptional regulator [candidate division WOR-3 bacterium]
MTKKTQFYIHKLEWLSPILVRGLRLLSSVEALEQTFSFSQVMVLQTLLYQKEMKMTELATYLGLSKANATGLVDRLVKRGLIERDRSAADRRVVRVSLTPGGVRTTRKLAARQEKGLVEMMKRIPEKDLERFITTLEQVARGLVESQGDTVVIRRR